MKILRELKLSNNYITEYKILKLDKCAFMLLFLAIMEFLD